MGEEKRDVPLNTPVRITLDNEGILDDVITHCFDAKDGLRYNLKAWGPIKAVFVKAIEAMTTNPKEVTLKACPSCEAEKIPLYADICLPCGEAGYTSKKLKIDKDEGESKDLPDAIPSTWLDPLLTGPDSIGPPPYNCKDIERLLNGLRERLKAKLSKPTAPADEGEKCWERECADCPKLRLEKSKAQNKTATLQAALAEATKKAVEQHCEIEAQIQCREDAEAKLKSAEAVVVTAGNVNEHFKHIVGATEEISQFGAELLLELRTVLSAHDKEKGGPEG